MLDKIANAFAERFGTGVDDLVLMDWCADVDRGVESVADPLTRPTTISFEVEVHRTHDGRPWHLHATVDLDWFLESEGAEDAFWYCEWRDIRNARLVQSGRGGEVIEVE